jgi:hypothetical protein
VVCGRVARCLLHDSATVSETRSWRTSGFLYGRLSRAFSGLEPVSCGSFCALPCVVMSVQPRSFVSTIGTARMVSLALDL